MKGGGETLEFIAVKLFSRNLQSTDVLEEML